MMPMRANIVGPPSVATALPFRGLVNCPRKFGDVVASILEGYQLATLWQWQIAFLEIGKPTNNYWETPLGNP
jgi:hypothetical protein